jgi:hypothetical protein
LGIQSHRSTTNGANPLADDNNDLVGLLLARQCEGMNRLGIGRRTTGDFNMATRNGGSGKRQKASDLRQAYDRLKKEFTAADLQKYTQDEPMIPAEQWLADMEAVYKEEMKKKKAGKA